MRIGLVGIGGTHPREFVRLINQEKIDPRVRIESVYDADEKGPKEFAEAHSLRVASSLQALAEESDAVIIADRRVNSHYEGAEPFLRAGKRTFVDKPLGHSPEEARSIIQLSCVNRAPLLTLSVLPCQRSFRRQILPETKRLGKLEKVGIRGPGSLHDPHGGVYFYGIHHAELLLAITGKSSFLTQCSNPTPKGEIAASVSLIEKEIEATIELIPGFTEGFQVTATGEKGTISETVVFDDDPYREGFTEVACFLADGKMHRFWIDMIWPITLLDEISKKAEKKE